MQNLNTSEDAEHSKEQSGYYYGTADYGGYGDHQAHCTRKQERKRKESDVLLGAAKQTLVGHHAFPSPSKSCELADVNGAVVRPKEECDFEG